MSAAPTQRLRSAATPWLTVRRQATIFLGVGLLLAVWLSGVVEPFVLGLPAYLIYFALHTPLEQLGYVPIEGSTTIFWISAVLWLYVLCSGVLALAIRASTARR